MQLKRAMLQRGPVGGDIAAADVDRTAGVVTLVGCAAAIVGAFLPWAETTLGVSLMKLESQSAPILLGVLALFAAAIASLGLLRRPPTAAVAIFLVVVASAQLGVAIWEASNIAHALARVDSREVLIRAIGTGLYPCVLGSMITLAGGVLAWTRRVATATSDGQGVALR